MKTHGNTASRLVDESIELCLEIGVHKLTFQKIASKLNISQPAIYKHFRNKDDLLMRCCEESAERGRQLIDMGVNPNDSGLQRLRSYVRGNLNVVSELPGEANLLLAMYYWGTHNKKFKELHSLINEIGIQRIEEYLSQINHEGKMKIKNRRVTASLIHGLLSGEMIKASLSKEDLFKSTWLGVTRLIQG